MTFGANINSPIQFNTIDFPGKIDKRIKIAFVADFHDVRFFRTMSSFESEKPDIICIAGDLISWHIIRRADMTLLRRAEIIRNHAIYTEECGHLYNSHYALEFLSKCVEIAPTFYSLGNHEKYFDERDRECVKKSGAVLLDNTYVIHQSIAIGGLTSAHVHNMKPPYIDTDNRGRVSTIPVSTKLEEAEIRWLDSFDKYDGFKILLCHHPEYYDRYLANTNIDLILAGHAHGGQIRIGSRGVYAPGQGFFPKYVSGLYHNRMIVSRGIANVSMHVPRINNIREIIYINLIPA